MNTLKYFPPHAFGTIGEISFDAIFKSAVGLGLLRVTTAAAAVVVVAVVVVVVAVVVVVVVVVVVIVVVVQSAPLSSPITSLNLIAL